MFETLPFASNGGDGLYYAWAVLAPELDRADYPCVSFAPVDDGGAAWLGRDTREGLANLLVGNVRGWERFGQANGAASPVADPRWGALIDRFGLVPDLASTLITAGARSRQKLEPEVPLGWRWEPAPDGLGVLAPAERFAPSPPIISSKARPADLVKQARALLRAGHAASALSVLKVSRQRSSTHGATVEAMRDAYATLGREMHASRAARWLERTREVRRPYE